jgi:hypothetical protein
MITLEIKINGKLIGQRTATRVTGQYNDQSSKYTISSPADNAAINVKHDRNDGAVKLTEMMLATLADDGTRNLAWK